MAQYNFDTNNVEKRESNFDLLPAGWYVAQVVESSVGPLKSGNGDAIKVTFEVLTQGYNGRKLWSSFNVRHNNPEAERIAQQQLRELCDAVGVVRMSDTVELHNKPVQIRVKVRKSTDPQYEDQNEIAGYKAAGGAAAPAMQIPARATSSQASAPAAAAPASSAPPWAKKTA